ncbi:DUF3696 domain-containing protein [Patulibacter sp. SYSU D01012]|uniref:N-6 DNA methylase n=1 Tax=Patulibacter sp. SYSU D01012 TaxID=2817381 RepID=UPI001B311729|nr:DUF3696 domain-containing protein [Patulibacter sp. SYSU D01012]
MKRPPSQIGEFRLEDVVFRVADATRSLGLEEGTDLLLQLIYLRWATERDQRDGGWDALRDQLTMSRQPEQILDRALEEHVPFWRGHYKSVAEDGGHALRFSVDALNAWPLGPEPTAMRDELHGAFEAVLRIRSQRLSRAGMESETPGSAARLMAALLPAGASLLDPACGIGSTLLAAASHAAAQGGHLGLHGWELNSTTAARARMRFELAGFPFEVHVGDAIADMQRSSRFDSIVVQPPWGLKLADHQWHSMPDLPFGKPGRSSADFVWLQLALGALAPHGRAVALMPQSTLLRGHSEGQIREGMLRDDLVEAIITLPAGVVPAASVASCVWILRRHAEPATAGKVLLIDATSLVEHQRARVELPAEGVELVAATVERWRRGEAPDAPAHIAAVADVETVLEPGGLLPVRHVEPAPVQRPVRPAPPRRLLTEIRAENFKSFGEQQRVRAAPITLVYGPNSAGKSSLLQSLLLLKQSLAAQSLVTQGELTDAGSFAGAVHRHDLDRTLSIGVEFGASDRWDVADGVPDPALIRSADFSFRADGSGLPQQEALLLGFGDFRLPLSAIDNESGDTDRALAIELDDLAPVFDGVAEGTLLYPFDSRQSPAETEEEEQRRLRSRRQNGKRALKLLRDAGMTRVPAIREGLLPSARANLDPVVAHLAGAAGRDPGIVNSYVNRSMQLVAGMSEELRRLLDELSYLGPLRSPPQRFYNRAAAAAGAGAAGEHIALHLFDNSSEVVQVNAWLALLEVPYTLKVVPVIASGSTAVVGDLVAIVLTDLRSKVEVSPADVGFGISQVLPIVVQLLATQDSVICIEQPEIHLHPGLQAKLGDLLIEATSDEGRANQVLIETHSEHLILRLQRRIREGALDADRVSVVYIEQREDGQARALQLRLDGDGDFLDEWPQGFFEERLDELFGGAE